MCLSYDHVYEAFPFQEIQEMLLKGTFIHCPHPLGPGYCPGPIIGLNIELLPVSTQVHLGDGLADKVPTWRLGLITLHGRCLLPLYHLTSLSEVALVLFKLRLLRAVFRPLFTYF